MSKDLYLSFTDADYTKIFKDMSEFICPYQYDIFRATYEQVDDE